MIDNLKESIRALSTSIATYHDASNQEKLELIESVQELNKQLEILCLKDAKFSHDKFTKRWIAQTLQFTIDLIPEIHRILLKYYKRSDELSLLDVGAGSGAGANLIASLHADIMIYSKINVGAIDYISKRYLWAQYAYPMIDYQVKDLYAVESKSWDLVVCSHCLEHVEEPKRFCDKLVEICKGFAFIYTPYNEIERIQDHLNTITEEFYNSYNTEKVRIFNSMAWHADKPEDKVILTTLDCRNI